jgi:VWFA-related protein
VKRPDDEVMIASIYNGLKINLQFTKDLDAVLASLDALKKAPTNGVYMQQARRDVERHLRDIPEGYSLHKLGAGPSRPGMSEQPPYGDAINAVQYYANNVLHSVSQTTDSAYSFIASLAGLDGRKIILFATEALPTYPGREAFEYLNAIKGEFSGGAHRQPVTENLNAYDATPMIVRIAEIANKSGVTLYPLHVGGPTQIMRGADEANDDKQNYNSLTGFKGVSAAQSINSTSVLPFLAEQTGGVALVESTNFDRVFDHIENDLSTYYSLGYRPERDASDAARNVQVKLRTDTGYIIRYRRGVVERTSESAQKEELTAALSHDAQKNELGISLQFLDAVAAADGGTKVPIRIVIPMDALTLMPDGTDLTGKLSIFVRFARNDGVMSEVSRRTNEFRFPASTRSRRKELTIQTDLTMDPGVRRVSVGVVDELSQISGFAIWEPPGTSGQ